MTTKYQDDITGEHHDYKQSMERFALITNGNVFADLDIHVDTVHEDPQAVAEALHEAVDEWLDDWQQHLEEAPEDG